MIRYIEGRVDDLFENGVILDHNGIGYEIYMNGFDLARLSVNQQVRIYTYLKVEEDAFSLFGFLNRDSLDLFLLLIKVNKVGPKYAIALLSALTAEEIRFAIVSGDRKKLTQANGIGAKTADQIILDLKDKIDIVDSITEQAAQFPDENENSAKNDAILFLENLGYTPSDILKAMSGMTITPEMDVNTIIHDLLGRLN